MVNQKGTAKSQKERDKIELEIARIGKQLLQSLREEVDSCIILCDVGRLERLTSIIHIYMDSEVIRALREKGFDKEIRKLCDKAGRVP